ASDDGILMFLAGRSRETDSRFTWFDRSGKMGMPERLSGPPATLSVSTEDKTAAVVQRQSGQVRGDIWLHDLTRGSQTRFTSNTTVDPFGNAIWSPDGNRIVFGSNISGAPEKSGVFTRDINGASEPELIVQNENPKIVTDWSKDGFLVFTE